MIHITMAPPRIASLNRIALARIAVASREERHVPQLQRVGAWDVWWVREKGKYVEG